jgi:hypothetical protein
MIFGVLMAAMASSTLLTNDLGVVNSGSATFQHGISQAVTPAAASAVAAESTGSPAVGTGANSLSPKARFLFADSRIHDDPEVLAPGFLSGLRGFEHFYEPIGNPLFFESPFINTSIRVLYLHHEFAEKSQLQGGDLNVYAVQARLALTERLAFIATKDGYSDLNADALPKDEGWNDIAAGFKYAFYVDREADMVWTLGGRYQAGNGDSEVLQGGVQEVSPFVSFAKGWEKFHLLGNVSFRHPLDTNKGNNILQWSAHADYEIYPGIAPVLELHGLHYLDDGNRLPLKVGGLDYTNLGSSDVGGSTVVWFGAGARFNLAPNVSLGSTYEYPLTNKNADIHGGRVTVDLIFTW